MVRNVQTKYLNAKESNLVFFSTEDYEKINAAIRTANVVLEPFASNFRENEALHSFNREMIRVISPFVNRTNMCISKAVNSKDMAECADKFVETFLK
jgi:uncharacterized protein YehS (DUF1456 family)